jgi:hypothetical protein
MAAEGFGEAAKRISAGAWLPPSMREVTGSTRAISWKGGGDPATAGTERHGNRSATSSWECGLRASWAVMWLMDTSFDTASLSSGPSKHD